MGVNSFNMKEMKKKQSDRLSREEWLERALAILAREGGRFSINGLVEKVGVSKGSFYWHFKGREDFVASIADYWDRTYTRSVFEHVNQLPGNAKERLFAVMKMVTRENMARYDLPVRAWASYEPHVAAIVRKVDKERLAFVGSLFAEMGFRGRELEMRTRTFVCYFSLESGLHVRKTQKERNKALKRLHAFFTRP
jgi:AcrR family transcriptional regulator